MHSFRELKLLYTLYFIYKVCSVVSIILFYTTQHMDEMSVSCVSSGRFTLDKSLPGITQINCIHYNTEYNLI